MKLSETNVYFRIIYYLFGAVFTAMVVFMAGTIIFALLALFIYTTILFLFSVQPAKEFQDFLNTTIVYFFNDNKQLFAWIALVIATPLFHHFNNKQMEQEK